ncbi:thioesterase family protein [Amaricoccus macauensis]|uniref:thioesterase family protein n=1 Tax=Amaricoccus macauensis TaxID=57001 RepID=UPI003C7AC098
MKPGLDIGHRAEFARKVPSHETVPRLFEDSELLHKMPDVYATAYMVGFMEWACCEHLAPFYDQGECSLGIQVDMSHTAPTVPGMTVTVTSEITAIEGRFVSFKVVARDDAGQIGEGMHRRALVDTDTFAAKAAGRSAGSIPA